MDVEHFAPWTSRNQRKSAAGMILQNFDFIKTKYWRREKARWEIRPAEGNWIKDGIELQADPHGKHPDERPVTYMYETR